MRQPRVDNVFHVPILSMVTEQFIELSFILITMQVRILIHYSPKFGPKYLTCFSLFCVLAHFAQLKSKIVSTIIFSLTILLNSESFSHIVIFCNTDMKYILFSTYILLPWSYKAEMIKPNSVVTN